MAALSYEPGDVETVVTPVMRYFDRPEVYTGVHRIHNVNIHPRSPLDITDTSDIEFNIPANTSENLDLGAAEVGIELAFLKRDEIGKSELAFAEGTLPEGQSLIEKELGDYTYPNTLEQADAECVVPIDAFLHTMFENCTLRLNQTTVYNSNNDHHYRSYLDLRVREEDEDMSLNEYKWLYTRENHTRVNDSVNPFIAKNQGACKRFLRIRHRQIIQLRGPVKCDFWKNTKHYLLNGVSVQLILSPAPNKFRLMITPKKLQDKFFLHVSSAYIDIPYVTISPQALKGVASGLESSPAIYPYVRTDFKIIPLHKGIRDIRCPELFDRQLPIDIIFAMVNRDNFIGSYETNPFFFNRNKLEFAAFYLDNVPIPGEPYVMGYPPDALEAASGRKPEDETLMTPLLRMYQVAGTTRNGININTFKDGTFIVGFKTDPSVPAHVPYWGVPKMGNTSLYLRFAEPLKEEQQLLILSRYPALVKIDKDRKVTVR